MKVTHLPETEILKVDSNLFLAGFSHSVLPFFLSNGTSLMSNFLQSYVNVVPTVVTKKVKKHWKRNEDKNEKLTNCG